MSSPTRLPGALLAAVLFATSAAAQAPVFSKDGEGRVIVRATRIAAPIKIDGRLDDEAYSKVEPITDFVQAEPQ